MLRVMIGKRSAARRWLSAGLLGLVFVPMPWSCQRRTPAPVAAPPPNYYQLGETAFEAGEYSRAIEAYSAYLRTAPGGPYVDRVLFRMAMAYSLPESPERNPTRAAELLGDLIRNYPGSPFQPPAELLVRQQSELQAQQSEVERLLADLGARESEIQNLAQELDRVRQVELEQMRTEVTRREERIRQLTEELERLKQIDLRHRPAVPLP